MTRKEFQGVQYLLINPPLTDPTVPYHSIPYLVGATNQAGFSNYTCLDSNIEALNYLAEEEHVRNLLDYCHDLRIELERKTAITRREEMLYRYALKAIGLKPTSILQSIQVMRDPEKFYNHETYRQAAIILQRWMDLLSVKGFPGQFDNFYIDTSNVLNISSVSELANSEIINKFVNPFFEYFDDLFRKKIQEHSWDFIALSVNYVSQLPFALWLCNFIRSISPQVIIGVGGTEISDIVKNLQDKSLLWTLFPSCDVVMVGEGETILIEILESIQQCKLLPKNCPGLLICNEVITSNQLLVRYEDVSNLPKPKYDVWLWNQYWSPEPIVLYSPTRGCYWNKCTFCDYGLNTDSPTSPSRERPVEAVVKELEELGEFARVIYFAVDAMSPSYLRRLSRAILKSGLCIQWSAELRLENSFTKEFAKELREAGCVCVSFGYESGSQRILNLIDKGVTLKKVPKILEHLSSAGIGVQMMGFIGFPGETPEESLATFQFLEENRSNWTLAGIGDFSLTSGSIIAKQPKIFGIKETFSGSGDDIIRWLSWCGEDKHIGDSHDAEISKDIHKIATSLKLIVGDRPFVGGIDSGHSILYFSKHGKTLLSSQNEISSSNIFSYPVYVKTPFHNIDNFIDKFDIQNYRKQLRLQGESVCFQGIMAWMNEYPNRCTMDIENNEQTLEIQLTGKFICMSSELAEAEQQRSPTYYAVKDMLLRGRGIS
jgi:anaerobic magnesium-protoporphyrin IX monomethyl ester cyclase